MDVLKEENSETTYDVIIKKTCESPESTKQNGKMILKSMRTCGHIQGDPKKLATNKREILYSRNKLLLKIFHYYLDRSIS